jgi:hypothetical protein
MLTSSVVIRLDADFIGSRPTFIGSLLSFIGSRLAFI